MEELTINVGQRCAGYSATCQTQCENDRVEISLGSNNRPSEPHTDVALVTLKKLNINLEVFGPDAKHFKDLVKYESPQSVYTFAIKLVAQSIVKKPSTITRLIESARRQGQKEGRNEIRDELAKLMECE